MQSQNLFYLYSVKYLLCRQMFEVKLVHMNYVCVLHPVTIYLYSDLFFFAKLMKRISILYKIGIIKDYTELSYINIKLNDNIKRYWTPVSNCTDMTCRQRERQNPIYDLTYEFCVQAWYKVFYIQTYLPELPFSSFPKWSFQNRRISRRHVLYTTVNRTTLHINTAVLKVTMYDVRTFIVGLSVKQCISK